MDIPYGITDFKKIRDKGLLYVDKTRYIEILEDKIGADFLFFIRPRRFGKTLFLSTLEYYYDLRYNEQFEDLFTGLYIGHNPTKLKNSYLILNFDFSGLNTGSTDELKKSFEDRILSGLIAFFKKYKKYFSEAEELIDELKKSSSTRRLDIFFNQVLMTEEKVFLIIDEYDHFANDLIAVGNDGYYKDVIRASGFVRDFYENIKIGTKKVIDKIFITGIAPIMLDDLTSGFNITSNITIEPLTNEMLGFTEEEVEEIINKLNIDVDMKMLKEYYNGYLFNVECEKRVYNPDMVLYYVNEWLKYKRPPGELITDNVKTDYGRLNRLVNNKVNQEILEKIIKEEKIVADLVSKFSFDRMYDQKYFISLLFYMGLLTIDKKIRTRLTLQIPNFVIKSLFWSYFEERIKEELQLSLNIEELKRAVEALAFDGQLNPYIEYVQNHALRLLLNRDLINFDDYYIKVILFSFLTQNNLYKPMSEREVEGGYIDIFLEKDFRFPEIKYEWLWELKYIKNSDLSKLEQVKKEGLKQLERYAVSDKFKDKDNLKKALIIFIGKDEYEIFLT